MMRQFPFHPPRKRGAAMVAALVALLVVSLVSALLIRSLVQLHRQSRREAWLLQANCLAESALARAAHQLQRNRQFIGETWNPSIGGAEPLQGMVRIRIEPVANEPQRRKIVVEAAFPDDPIHRATARRELLIHLPPAGDSP